MYSKQIKNYNVTFKRVDRRGIVFEHLCEICRKSDYYCLTKRLCGKLYSNFWRHWVYVV